MKRPLLAVVGVIWVAIAILAATLYLDRVNIEVDDPAAWLRDNLPRAVDAGSSPLRRIYETDKRAVAVDFAIEGITVSDQQLKQAAEQVVACFRQAFGDLTFYYPPTKAPQDVTEKLEVRLTVDGNGNATVRTTYRDKAGSRESSQYIGYIRRPKLVQ